MIDRDLVLHLVRRFAGLPGYPRDEVARDALIDAFERAPHDDAQAAQIGDDLLVECHKCPVPADVWQAARAQHSDKYWSRPSEPDLTLDDATRQHRELLASHEVSQLAAQMRCKPEDLWGTVDEAAAAWRARHIPRRRPQRETAPAAAAKAETAEAM